MSIVSKLRRSRAQHIPRRHIILVGVLAAGTLVGLAVAGSPAYAGTPQITAVGGPGEIYVTGGGFTPGTIVRLEVHTPSLSETLQTIDVTADSSGKIAEWPSAGVNGEYAYFPGLNPYVGDAWVSADGAPGPTAWAKTHVYPEPTFWADFFGCPSPPGHVVVGGYGFQAGDSVRVELLKRDSSGELGSVMDTVTATVDSMGNLQVPRELNVEPGYAGGAAVIADEFLPGPVTVGANPGYVC